MSTTTTEHTTTEDVKAKAGEAAGQAKEKLHDAADQAKEQAGQASRQAKGRVRDQLDQRSTEFGERASSTAGDLRSVSEQLRAQGKDQPADLADQFASRVEQAADYLRDNGPDRLLGDAERFGRERPWAVIAGGLAIGFAASRLLKSTSADRYHAGTGTTAYTPAQTGYGARTGNTAQAGRPSPLDDIAAGAERVRTASQPYPGGQPATGASTPGGAGGAYPGGTVPSPEPITAPPSARETTINREREGGLGSNGLS